MGCGLYVGSLWSFSSSPSLRRAWITLPQANICVFRIAFVEFFTEEDFDEAWEKKDSVRINGRKLDLTRCEEDTYEKQDLQTLSKFLPKSGKHGTETVEESETPKSFFDRNKKSRSLI